MIYDNLIQQWKCEEERPFAGWDFNHINARCISEELPWSYSLIIKRHLKSNSRLLDIGTGGGEFLLELAHPYALTSATEAYPPNVELCKKKLAPLGITVKQTYPDMLMPFKNESFDIIINRHEDYSYKEVLRILRPGGVFITQQVGCTNNNDLSRRIINGFIPQFTKGFSQYKQELESAGCKILTEGEYFPFIRFYDIGALVYFAKIIEWEFPGFSVAACRDNLLALQNELTEKGFVQGTEHRFILAALKP